MPELLLVAGERRDAVDGATFTVIDPSTGESPGDVAKAGIADVDAALAVATPAFDDGRLAPHRRHRAGPGARTGSPSCCASAAERLRRGRGPQRRSPDRRRPVGGRRGRRTFEYYAGAANKHLGSVVPVQDDGLDVVLREPVGPVRPHRAVELPAA